MEKGNKKSILITGASTGFGKLTAQTLAAQGHKVFASMRGVVGKNSGHASALLQWAEEEQADLTVIELDVTSDASVKSAAVTLLAQTGGNIDVIINNAGIYGMALQETFTVDDYKQNFDVNVFGPARVNNEFLPVMRKQGSGLIIQISSILGRLILPYSGVYNATKWAAEALAESLYYELAPLGIESVIVQPGPFKTEIFGKPYLPENIALADSYGIPQEKLQQYKETFVTMMSTDIPNQPQHVADVIANLVNLPDGQRPLRTVVDQVFSGTQILNDAAESVQKDLLNNLGLGDLLPKTQAADIAV